MVRYAYEFKDYEFGIYWDSWSQPQEIVRGYEEMKKLGDRWKTQPIGGEITWNWGDLARFKSFEEVVAGSLSVFVLTILQYVGIYGEEELQAVAQVLKQGSGLSNLEKRKSQIDYMVEKRKYAAAIRGYDMLLETWSDLEREGRELPAGKVRAAILHNKGVALTGLMLYDKAAEYFREAWQADPDRSHLDAYLAAKRMELTEDAYVAFAARNPEFYTESLELEKSMEQFGREWEQQPEFRQLKLRREWRANDRQKYDAENERLITALKNSYRTSVNI